MPHRVLDQFERVLVQDNTKIQSICKDCRFVIVASVSEGLQDREVQHAKDCPEHSVTLPMQRASLG